jgi:8-oxo-dGTP pyrophosphatase MutT (NUDIX family)
LILKRVANRGSFWQPVCGGIELNELPMQTAKREIFEETGISRILDIIDLGNSFQYETTKNNTIMKMKDICFGAEVSQLEIRRTYYVYVDKKG